MSTLPEPGDAVRLTDTWPWAGDTIRIGEIGIIGGMLGTHPDHLSVCWHPSTHRSKVHVSCSGGPATIALPSDLLKPTDDKVTVYCWDWDGLPRAGGGREYSISVPVWEWNGKGY